MPAWPPVRRATTFALVATLAGCTPTRAAAQLTTAQSPTSAGAPKPADTIGIVDLYGLGQVPADRVRSAMTFREGDAIVGGVRSPSIVESEARLAALPGVRRARITLVCCDNGRSIAYVGIEEDGAPRQSFRDPPTGSVRLAPDIVQAGAEFDTAFVAAIRRGVAGEDRSQGHALAHDPATRAIQERFVGFAARDAEQLRRVLRHSSVERDRALAAQVLGYARDKAAVTDDLSYAMGDPAEEVRNNAMRALMVIAEIDADAGAPRANIPPAPFVAMLRSPAWTDRNKASLALFALSHGRDPRLLAALRQGDAITPLVEMARWRSEGHAQAAFIILGRVAGFSDEETMVHWTRGERETVIAAAVARR